MTQRLGIAFHQTFKLDRTRLLRVLEVADRFYSGETSSRSFSLADLSAAATSLGKNMVKALPAWGTGTGLLLLEKPGHYELSQLGRCVFDHDPSMQSMSTQWLMHFHLSAPFGPGPLFWHRLFAQELRPGMRFSGDVIEKTIKHSATDEGRSATATTVSNAKSVFLNTYLPEGGLEYLNLISPDTYNSGLFEVSFFPQPIPCYAFGYALIDHWERVWGDKLTVDLESLFEQGGLADMLLLDRRTVEDYLTEIERQGWISVFRVAPPYQLVRKWTNAVETKMDALRVIFQQ